MSNYYIGVDVGAGGQATYLISKYPGRFMRWVNKVLKRGDKWKIIYCGSDPNQIRKWRYRSATVIKEG